ncbi:MAG: Aim21 family protein [Ktedonobacteraceae bacterium]
MPSNTTGRTISNDEDNPSLPPRPPSVSLPSLGQEGSEYADLQYEDSAPKPAHAMEDAAQTRNVGGDLQLHAPKPSLPTASAKTQVEAVTKTTSKQAAALGLGKPGTPVHDEHEHPPLPLRAKSSFSRPASSASNERRLSVQYGEEQGSTEIGIRVPINPNLGEVQAPSPSPFGDRQPGMAGSNGAHGQRKRHIRTMSGREVFLPPGSYGLHGHGVPTQDKFEKDWYAKHPEQYLHDEDQGHYSSTGTGRGEFALSSDDLNHIVRSTASRGAGFGMWLSCRWRGALC